MKFIKQSIPEVILIEPQIHGDQRGYFMETFRHDLFEQAVGRKIDFVQDNESKSSKGVLRGLHFQLPPHAQSKLVRVIEGEVLDVAVDIRHGSPTFGQHVAQLLSDVNKRQLFVPRGFAHGFLVLSEEAVFSYKVDNYYHQKSELGIAYNDSDIKIDWDPTGQSIELLLSQKDTVNTMLSALTDTLAACRDEWWT